MFFKACSLVAIFQLVGAVAAAENSASTVVVRGLVYEADSGQGVADVEIVLSNGAIEATVRSDAAGEYEGRIAPGLITGEIKKVPSRYAKPHRAFDAPVSIPNDAAELTLPKIELPPGRSVRGQVVDDAGRPLPGAEVQICWLAMEPWLGSKIFVPKRLATTAGADGAFLLEGLDPDDRMWLGTPSARIFANHGKLTSGSLQELIADANQPTVLRVAERRSVSIEGRVVDSDGRPVVGAVVQLWTQWQRDNGMLLGRAAIAFVGQNETRTDEAGRFVSPGGVAPDGEYAALVRAEGYIPARTRWTRGVNQGEVRFADLKLVRPRTVSGRVIDRLGRPLAGVRVFQAGDGVERTETKSDSAGHYELPGVSDDEAFLFAQHSGFRFHGQAIAPRVLQAEVTLARVDEPPEAFSPQPPSLSREEELELVRGVYRPYFELAMAGDDVREQSDALVGWGRLDPGDVLARIDDASLPSGREDDYDLLRRNLAKAIFHESPEEALAVVESISEESWRVRAYIELAGAVSAPKQDFKRRLLEEALLGCQNIDDPSVRALWLHCVADGFLDTGDEDLACAVLEQARALAAVCSKAGSGGLTRGRVAEALVKIDLPAAIELAQEIEEDRIRVRTFGSMAFRISAARPADVERLLERIKNRFDRDEWIVRCCYRMAPADSARARRLADKIANPFLRSHALGLMARSCAESDKSQARRWVDDAFEILDCIISAGEERLDGRQDAAMTAGLLVSAIDQIDSQLVPEYFWRAIACRRSPSQFDEEQTQSGTAMLGLLLAQYDRRVARTLIEPIIELQMNGADSLAVAIAFDAACIIDPYWAVELLRRLPDASGGARRRRYFEFAWAFGVRQEIRLRALVQGCELFWLPGEPDNAFQSEF